MAHEAPYYATQHLPASGPPILPAPPPAPPTRLAPAAPQTPTCAHLWTCDSSLLRCYHCGWTYRAVLARAKAVEAVPHA